MRTTSRSQERRNYQVRARGEWKKGVKIDAHAISLLHLSHCTSSVWYVQVDLANRLNSNLIIWPEQILQFTSFFSLTRVVDQVLNGTSLEVGSVISHQQKLLAWIRRRDPDMGTTLDSEIHEQAAGTSMHDTSLLYECHSGCFPFLALHSFSPLAKPSCSPRCCRNSYPPSLPLKPVLAVARTHARYFRPNLQPKMSLRHSLH